jgi:DNA-directed RNA polymerase specialized sigma24 family protein
MGQVKDKDQSRKGLNADEFRALLDRLGTGPEQAAQQYENLRQRVIKSFTWEQCEGAEDLADECLDRVARKLDDGVEILNLHAYLAGVARMMVKEYHFRRRRELAVIEECNRNKPDSPGEDIEQAVMDLDDCLKSFAASQRNLLLQYYEGDHGIRIENRKRLAEELGMLPNALRNRAMRLRALLEACMAARMRNRDGSGVSPTIGMDART